MQARPLVNCRDESHASEDLARLHIIFFDNILSPTARYLMAGTTQLVCAMGEAGWIDPDLQLDDPVEAALEVSRDMSMRQPLPMAQRLRMTAAEVQAGLVDQARAFRDAGGLGDAVPGAEAIIACWAQTTELARQGAIEALARRCDWALKFLVLDRHRGRKGLTWQSPQLQYLDILFSDLDPQEGLFWQMAAAGQVDAMPDPDRVEWFLSEPPDDTRAFLRAQVLRRFGDQVHSMDWDHLRFRWRTHRRWYAEARLDMLRPGPARPGRGRADPGPVPDHRGARRDARRRFGNGFAVRWPGPPELRVCSRRSVRASGGRQPPVRYRRRQGADAPRSPCRNRRPTDRVRRGSPDPAARRPRSARFQTPPHG